MALLFRITFSLSTSSPPPRGSKKPPGGPQKGSIDLALEAFAISQNQPPQVPNPWTFLGPPWDPSWALLAPSWATLAVLGPSWGPLDIFWGSERTSPSAKSTGPLGGPLGPLLGTLGALSGPSWGPLGHSRGSVEALFGLRETLGRAQKKANRLGIWSARKQPETTTPKGQVYFPSLWPLLEPSQGTRSWR